MIEFSKKTKAAIAMAALMAVIISFYLLAIKPKNSGDVASDKISQITSGSAAGTVRINARKLLKLHSAVTKNSDNHKISDHTGDASKSIASDPFSNVAKSRDNLDFESDPFLPKSKEEQKWLDRHGYPNAEQWREYNAASDVQLELAADNGDIVAETLLNSRRVYAGDEGAEAAMLYSAALGNTFALEMLSSSMATGKNGHDPIDGYAFSRVAEMRGNLTLGLGREAIFPVNLSSQQRFEAEGRALYYFNILVETQKQIQGDNAVIVDMRPITVTDG